MVLPVPLQSSHAILRLLPRKALFLAYIAVLAACAGQPYIDSRREAGQTAPVGTSTPDRVAICYSSRATTPQTLQRLADDECAKTGRVARFDGQDRMTCALQAPTRAYFRCVAR